MKIGILGGTFDPIHEGHLAVAEHARKQFQLDRVFFVPAAVSPFKIDQPCGASSEARLAMVQLALAGHPHFEAVTWELDRGGISYTADTLRYFHEKFPEAEIFLLMGEDALAGLARWKEPQTVRKLARLVVAPRQSDSAARRKNGEILWLDMPLQDASSTEIRKAMMHHRPEAFAPVPETVRGYIRAHNIYGSSGA